MSHSRHETARIKKWIIRLLIIQKVARDSGICLRSEWAPVRLKTGSPIATTSGLGLWRYFPLWKTFRASIFASSYGHGGVLPEG